MIFLCFALSGDFLLEAIQKWRKDKNAYYSEKLGEIKIPYKKQT